VIVACPGATPVTIPEELTEAVFGSLDDHTTEKFVAVDGCTNAVNCLDCLPVIQGKLNLCTLIREAV
jgi:hypothetical protein